MTRFGVMKHLAVLEAAGLVVTHRQGRTKLHYLNPVPIREIQERWISKYAESTVAAMVGLRRAARIAHSPTRPEPPEGAPVAKPLHMYQTFIKAPRRAGVGGDQ